MQTGDPVTPITIPCRAGQHENCPTPETCACACDHPAAHALPFYPSHSAMALDGSIR